MIAYISALSVFDRRESKTIYAETSEIVHQLLVIQRRQ